MNGSSVGPSATASGNDAGRTAVSFSKGDRVCSSELGSLRHPRYAKLQGTVVRDGNGRYPNSVRVLWDGSRTAVAIHRDYIQLIPCASASSTP
ncbi:hypothetical protein [Bradyrhizobium prioriisuperbiae]|uniref:hypothetical protein n=1 Tax=Bradyrhizobium prioriisuperbiae TaxID=2854389 RepID=UPI0028E6517E|nr:hypothetical protein [Bradyrhizobium prioritasuperba]